ncbi:MAG TPA: hypothetical protein ENI51_00535 [Candidatus Atribacteria bacterium]|nr:MAG: hypothetical protein KIIPBIDF_01570 [Candidatus Methanoperedenaceae archaeon GB50]HEC91479.1 hypothetical protein [Candidatus Atribacteria bacterium]
MGNKIYSREDLEVRLQDELTLVDLAAMAEGMSAISSIMYEEFHKRLVKNEPGGVDFADDVVKGFMAALNFIGYRLHKALDEFSKLL